MAPPRLTFFCELDSEPLQALFGKRLISDLIKLKANISLGIVDLSPERAEVVHRLNQAGVPVIAWLLLPRDQGYWFNLDNAPQAVDRYADFRAWTAEYALLWDGIGLDIEPDIRELSQFAKGNLSLLPRVISRLFNRRRLAAGRAHYLDLISRIRADGYRVDSYQFPVIADERLAHSTLLQRGAGLVDLPVDREVWMLYSNFVRPNGAGLLASYAPEAQSIGLGSTGGGVDSEFGTFPALTWDEFARDLRLSWRWCDDLHIFSLEGCVQQGFIPRLKTFVWDYPIMIPEQSLLFANNLRGSLRSVLWLGMNLWLILAGAGVSFLVWKGLQRWLRKNKSDSSQTQPLPVDA
jgi:hypothetical protein